MLVPKIPKLNRHRNKSGLQYAHMPHCYQWRCKCVMQSFSRFSMPSETVWVVERCRVACRSHCHRRWKPNKGEQSNLHVQDDLQWKHENTKVRFDTELRVSDHPFYLVDLNVFPSFLLSFSNVLSSLLEEIPLISSKPQDTFLIPNT